MGVEKHEEMKTKEKRWCFGIEQEKELLWVLEKECDDVTVTWKCGGVKGKHTKKEKCVGTLRQ